MGTSSFFNDPTTSPEAWMTQISGEKPAKDLESIRAKIAQAFSPKTPAVPFPNETLPVDVVLTNPESYTTGDPFADAFLSKIARSAILGSDEYTLIA